MLWGRAAMRCSHPECRMDLFEDESDTDDPTLIGENCHMIAEGDTGPRANKLVSIEHRNSYSNLILLCSNHHKIIDAQEGKYTLEYLHKMKADHEEWVRNKLSIDTAKQRDDEYYAGLIDQWGKLANLDSWRDWSSWVLGGGQPSIPISVDENISELREWLLTRVWPQRYIDLEISFHNFRSVAADFQNCFRKYAKKRGDKFLETEKFYHIKMWDPDLYEKLLDRFNHHVDLIQDLMLELTRAANLICDLIRQYVLARYRIVEGRLLVESGPTMDLTYKQYIVQYSSEERKVQHPYPGLAKFIDERAERDIHFGSGAAP